MQTKKTFWVLTSLTLIVTIYFLSKDAIPEKWSLLWKFIYFPCMLFIVFMWLLVTGSFRFSEQEENVEHMLDYFPKEKSE